LTTAPTLRSFGALWFCYFATIGTFNPYAPLWFKELGFSTLAIGTLASLQSWTRVLSPYGWGWLGDHGGHRIRLVHVATLFCVFAAAGLLWARGYTAVAACTVLLYLANGAVMPLSEASIAHHLATAQGLDTTRYGRVRMWGSVGFIAAVLIVGVVLQGAGIGAFPVLVVGSCTLLALAAWRVPDVRDDISGHERATGVAAVLRRPEVAWFFASVFFTVLAHTSVYAFFSLYLDSRGYSKAAVGALWAVSVAAEIAFFAWQGRAFQTAGAHHWLQWAAGLSALRFMFTAAGGALWPLLVLAQAMHAFTFAAHHASCIVLISRHFPGALRGRGQALYTVLGYGAPGVIGGFGGGLLSQHFGFEAVFWAAVAASAAGVACAARSQRAVVV